MKLITINKDLKSWQQPKYFFFNFLMPFYYMFFSRRDIKQADTFCLFIGYPRSSHTLIGALLDAHPNIVISTEANSIRMLFRGYPKMLVFGKIIAKSKWFAQNGATWTGYSYRVPKQHQGKYSNIKIIGDKKGEQTTAIVRKYNNGFEFLNGLEAKLNKKVKMIHVIRNPFDNITTIAKKGGDSKPREVTQEVLNNAINRYFLEVSAVQRIKKECKYPIFDLKNEDLIYHTKKTLVQLCDFLQITLKEDYITDCENIILTKQKKTRDSITWTEKDKNLVQSNIKKFPFLSEYTFNN